MMKRGLPLLVVMLFVAGFFIVPAGVPDTSARLQETNTLNDVTLEQDTEPSWLPFGKTVRVALYNETNTTTPVYTTGTMNDNYTSIYDVFANAGYDVTRITFTNILNHELNTANYDVLILADNNPRENITDLVREFWLGGGGILAIDSSAGYLGYAGILPRDGLGSDDGLGTYWDYNYEDTAIIDNRHPVTKSYAKDDSLSFLYADWAQYDITALFSTSVSPDLTVLAVDNDNSDFIQAIAMDPSDMGGKVVHMGIPMNPWPSDWEDMMIDAVEWLCPRPKGRILFDLTHQPYYGVDSWDAALSDFDTKFEDWRAALVNRSYTFDKLWPSASGNLTAENLQDYDMLIALCPGLNYTSAEVQAVMNWVSAGGGLLAFGEQNTGILLDHRANMNYLLNGVGLQVNATNNIVGTLDSFATFPTSEFVATLTYAAAGVVDTSGAAIPIVTSDNGDVFAGATDYNNGRIILVNDINVFDVDRLYLSNNRKFAINIANWLTSTRARVLVYTDGGNMLIDPDYNFYRSPVARALNELGLKFLMTNDAFYFNLSLNTESWDLAILDENLYSAGFAGWAEIKSFIAGGGKFIGRSWSQYFVESLGGYLGFSTNLTTITTGPPTVYPWVPGHEIFNIPNDYGADNISASNNYFNTDYRHYEPLANGTALAGITQSPSGNNSAIIKSNVVPAIVNAFSISQYFDDTDDSTYGDGFEIFMNEIAYLMRPQVDSPADFAMEYGDTGVTLTWTPTSDRPYEYQIMQNAELLASSSWDGGPISILLDGYQVGTYTFDVVVWDSAGYFVADTVVVTVEDTTSPAFVDGPDNLFYQEGTVSHLLNWSFTELLPDSWVLYINGSVQDNGSWDGLEISADAGGLTEGTYNATIAVNDTSNNVATSTVTLVVGPPPTTTTTPTGTTSTTPTDTGTTTPPPGDNTLLIIIIAVVAGVVVIIIIIVLMKKKS
ncbi:MAG: hypothetical protein ACFFF4_11640 [Candidatus Thorarchaeota archaeon]